MTVKHQIADLEGPYLNYAVALIQGLQPYLAGSGTTEDPLQCVVFDKRLGSTKIFDPANQWGDCGPIIERAGISPKHSRIFIGNAFECFWRVEGLHPKEYVTSVPGKYKKIIRYDTVTQSNKHMHIVRTALTTTLMRFYIRINTIGDEIELPEAPSPLM